LSLIDIINTFVPSRFGNPAWEFQVVGSLVERAAVPLLGLVLVLSAETSVRIFKFLCWASLVVGVLFLLLVPLGISSSWRIDQQNQRQISTQINQQTAQIQQLQNLLSQANTAEEITSILARLNPQRRPPAINNPQEVKSRLLSDIAQAQKTVRAQAQANQAQQRQALVRNALKWCIGAVVASVVFFSIWGKTRKALKVTRQRGPA
jgi:preprotein translocase subunit SecF